MQRIAQFYKVSEENFSNAMRAEFPGGVHAAGTGAHNADSAGSGCRPHTDTGLHAMYEALKLPQRATKGSAGYDFYAPFSFSIPAGAEIKIPTGIRVRMEDGWVLKLYPRSGLGFKYRLQLNNTVGVIDSDYYYSDNEGHIFIKLTNDSREGKTVEVAQGSGFAQGIFLEYGITVDDGADGERNGGFGSTGGGK